MKTVHGTDKCFHKVIEILRRHVDEALTDTITVPEAIGAQDTIIFLQGFCVEYFGRDFIREGVTGDGKTDSV